MNRMILGGAALLLGANAFAQEVEALPGQTVEQTIAQNGKQSTDAGYATPAHLRYPYVAAYWIRPNWSVGDTVKIGYYVADYLHSKHRFNDDSARFDVTLRLTCGDGKWIEKKQTDVKTGDGRFDVEGLGAGMWAVSLTAFDRKAKLPSHTVWQEFRVLEKGALDIPAEKTYRMAEADLVAYGIRNDGDYGRLVAWDASAVAGRIHATSPLKLNALGAELADAYLNAHPHQDDPKRPGYAAYVPALDGKPVFNAWRLVRIVYDKGYDRDLVATNAIRTAEGLQKLLDDKAAAGMRKVVLLPGTYRVSGKRTLRIPDRMTLDLNGATLKLDGFTGCKSLMVKISAVTDAVLENGTLAGDYYEHDYAGSDSKSEWVMGFGIGSCARYCEVRNVTIRDITGYGGGNGIGTDGPGKWHTFALPGVGGKSGINAYGLHQTKWTAGGLRLDGTLDESDRARWTSGMIPLKNFAPFGWVQVSKLLGSGHIRTRNWTFTIAYYDAAQKFISAEIGFQYRTSRIPEGAATARVSIEVASEEEAKKNGMSVAYLKFPINCGVRDCRFVRCRAVGYAMSQCRNFLMRENEFTECGETLAKCAFDAEDGGDGMQDVLFYKNDFHDNRNNELLTCAGHNFQLVGNRAAVHFYARTFSPCVRDNDIKSASFICGNRIRTGYARFENNRYREKLDLGGGAFKYSDWNIVMDGYTFSPETTGTNFVAASGPTGLFRNCAFKGVGLTVGNAENCTFTDCRRGGLVAGRQHHDGVWRNCRAENGGMTLCQSSNRFENCTFRNFRLGGGEGASHVLVNCTLDDSGYDPRQQRKQVTGEAIGCTLKGNSKFPKGIVVR